MVPYTPVGSNVAEGDVVVLGNTAGITVGVVHRPIVENTLGEIAVGGGIYEMTAIANTNAFTEVFVDAANTSFDGAANTGQHFGYTTEAAVANNVSEVFHHPFVDA